VAPQTHPAGRAGRRHSRLRAWTAVAGVVVEAAGCGGGAEPASAGPATAVLVPTSIEETTRRVLPADQATTTTVELIAYIVQPGDTLYGVAAMFGVSIESVAKASRISDIAALHNGQTLLIPVPAEPAERADPAETTTTSGAAPPADPAQTTAPGTPTPSAPTGVVPSTTSGAAPPAAPAPAPPPTSTTAAAPTTVGGG